MQGQTEEKLKEKKSKKKSEKKSGCCGKLLKHHTWK